jgi:plastocyanin
MNKALAVFLLLAGLVAIVRSADIAVAVGSDDAAKAFQFNPNLIEAKMGDNIVFTWAGKAPHSIVQTDAAKSCTKSASLTEISSDGPFTAPKTWTYTPKATGKMWIMCGVADHCSAKQMYATINVVDAAGGAPAGGAPSGGAGGAMPSGAAPSGGAGGASGATPSSSGGAGGAAGASATPSSANRNYLTSGLVFSSMCMVAAYML